MYDIKKSYMNDVCHLEIIPKLRSLKEMPCTKSLKKDHVPYVEKPERSVT